MNGGHFAVSQSGNDVYLDFDSALAQVPEPSTLALLTVSAVGLIGWAWRRRKKGRACGSMSRTRLLIVLAVLLAAAGVVVFWVHQHQSESLCASSFSKRPWSPNNSSTSMRPCGDWCSPSKSVRHNVWSLRTPCLAAAAPASRSGSRLLDGTTHQRQSQVGPGPGSARPLQADAGNDGAGIAGCRPGPRAGPHRIPRR